MNDWEYEMWWDAVNGMEDDDDDWQGGRPINFLEYIKRTEATKFFSYV